MAVYAGKTLVPQVVHQAGRQRVMAKRPPSYAEQMLAAQKRTESAGPPIPSADAVTAAQQLKAAQDIMSGIALRRLCIEQAVASSANKDWSPGSVRDLAVWFHEFITNASSPQVPE